MFYNIDGKRWIFLILSSFVCIIQYPILFWPMSMASQINENFKWSNQQNMFLIGAAFLPNIIFCLIFGIFINKNPNGLVLCTLVICMLSTWWFITSISHQDYASALLARMVYGVGALNSMNIS